MEFGEKNEETDLVKEGKNLPFIESYLKVFDGLEMYFEPICSSPKEK